MQALSDEQRVDALEKKIDDGFAEMRAEFKTVRAEMHSAIGEVRRELHADIRALAGVVFTMFLTMILGFAGLILTHL